jgi:hypothetical protein
LLTGAIPEKMGMIIHIPLMPPDLLSIAANALFTDLRHGGNQGNIFSELTEIESGLSMTQVMMHVNEAEHRAICRIIALKAFDLRLIKTEKGHDPEKQSIHIETPSFR